MPRVRPTSRSRALAGASAALVAMAVGAVAAAACAGTRAEPRPVATLASSPRAAAAFEAIRDAWRDPDRSSPAELRAMLERFVAQFPTDGLVPLARIALALVALDQGDVAAADAQMSLTEGLPAGTAHDLWTVARARRLRMRGEPEAALAMLRPLVGKGVDPLVRSVFEEELTLAALATHREYEAISYMDAWLRATPEEDKPRTVRKVVGFVDQLPEEVLVGALRAMRTQRASLGYGAEIERILGDRLVAIATKNGDAELARMLLDSDAGAISVAEDAATALGELATSRRGMNVVEGRTIGLLLPTDSPGLRDEAADVLRGMMWALGLPRGVRRSGPADRAASDGGAASAPAACAPLQEAPETQEPDPAERVRLVTRDDAGSADRTEVSLDELAGEGAAVVVAGLDGQTAARALRWGDNHGVPVIALVPPDATFAATGSAGASFAFVLGERRADVVDALTRAAPSLAGQPVAPVLDASEVTLFPPQGGRVGPLTLTPPVSCDIPPVRAGEPRFPVGQWDHDRTRAWLVSGSPACALDLVRELSAARGRGVVALTLEAAGTPAHAAALRVVSAQAGVVPASPPDDPRDDELRRFRGALGDVGWWTALGRDAATLARAAVRELPSDQASDPRAVSERRARARAALAGVRARLWTTEASGWGEAQAMPRTVCALDVPARP